MNIAYSQEYYTFQVLYVSYLSPTPPHTPPGPLRHICPPQAPLPIPKLHDWGCWGKEEHQLGSTMHQLTQGSTSTSTSIITSLSISQKFGIYWQSFDSLQNTQIVILETKEAFILVNIIQPSSFSETEKKNSVKLSPNTLRELE